MQGVVPIVMVGRVLAAGGSGSAVRAQTATGIEFRVLATAKTSTMEKELNEGADAGFRFQAVMGGSTAFGGNEVVAVMSRSGPPTARYVYTLLASNKTSTMQKELQDAANAGFEYRGQTIFKAVLGGEEVVCILERDKEAPLQAVEYQLVATSKTGTLEKEL